MRTERYTAEEIRREVLNDFERLFSPYAVGRPDRWTPDPRTKEMLSIYYWLVEQLVLLGVSDDDRRTQQSFYNRWSRQDEDLFDLAARALNAVLDGNVQQNRKPHRRWG